MYLKMIHNKISKKSPCYSHTQVDDWLQLHLLGRKVCEEDCIPCEMLCEKDDHEPPLDEWVGVIDCPQALLCSLS